MKKIKLNTSIVTNKWLMGIATTAIGVSTFSLLQDQAHASEHNYQKMQQNASLNQKNWDKKTPNNQSNKNYTFKQNHNSKTSSYISKNETTKLANKPKPNLTTLKKQPKPSPAPVMNKSTVNTGYKQTKPNTQIISKPVPSNKQSSSSKKVIHSTKPISKAKPTTTKQKSKTTIVNKANINNKKPSQNIVLKQATSKTSKTSNVKPKVTSAPTKQQSTKSVKQTQSTTSKKAVVVSKTNTKPKTTVPTKPAKKAPTKPIAQSTVKPNTQTVTKQPVTKTTVSKNVTPPPFVLGEVKPTDTYRSMSELFAHTTEGKDWIKERSNRNSNALIIAPHGGNIEKGTTELAKSIANKGNYDYYAFNAIRDYKNNELHVTSTNYDDKDLINSNYNRDVSIAIHGMSDAQYYNTVLVGGRNFRLMDLISQELKGLNYIVKEPTGYLAGRDKRNVVNFNKNGMGIQLEITRDIRKSFFKDGNDLAKARKDVNNWTPEMDNFATAINNAIKNYMK
ncbi:hypothetical protein CD127_06945 [Staphylococcus petrasii]|uniref:poly-gamma-glutamate hydrolase family protein n=1 Tax=Staphylococcus petrasii TaxID=1276936 RepID=UPI000CD31F47|nr:poly-gamma-glutamate hydrolase family protein [Staphylococcus petrasii]PNZ81972.1 hypothetical protein CD127_06945 [Staphylococcus petrasii]TGA81511.1 hypothetical protein E2554_08345 [Staphylococcus petrasii]SUM58992.1 Phage-related replication protein [Staphylococcus petrasii]